MRPHYRLAGLDREATRVAICKVLADGPASRRIIEAAILGERWGATTIASCLGTLRGQGLVECMAGGSFRLTPAGVAAVELYDAMNEAS